LKDLPWWVFGLKYLFGYETEIYTEREMIVILKAEIINQAEERKSQAVSTEEQIEQERKIMTDTPNLFEDK